VEVKESKGWASKALLGISLVALMVGAVFMAHGPPLGFVPSVHNVAPLLQAYSKGLAWEAPAPATGWKKYVHAAKYAIQVSCKSWRGWHVEVEGFATGPAWITLIPLVCLSMRAVSATHKDQCPRCMLHNVMYWAVASTGLTPLPPPWC
jgi:hypothetical protein